MELKGKKALFLGDSITEGVGTSSPEHIYLNVLKEKYGMAQCVNYGISGSRIARCAGLPISELTAYNEDFCLRLERMEPDADLVVVFGGTNDFGHGNAPIGTPQDRTPDTFWGACHYLMEGLMTKYPRAQIVFMTPLHREWEDAASAENKNELNSVDLCAYREILMEAARYYAIPVLDLYSISGIQPQVAANRELYLPDGLHPSDAGNARIANLLGNFLQQL